MIVLISLSGLMACAGHNTASRLDSLEERATDQDIIKLRMDTAEARLLVLEEDLTIVKEYTIPRGARWVEPKAQKAAILKPGVLSQTRAAQQLAAQQSGVQQPAAQPPAAQPPAAQQSGVQVNPYNNQSYRSYSEPSSYSDPSAYPAISEPASSEPASFEPASSEPASFESASSEPASFEPKSADLKPLQPVYAYDNILSLEKPVQEQISSGSAAIVDLTDSSATVYIPPAPLAPASSSPKVQPADSSLKGLPHEFITGTRSYDQALARYYQGKYKEAVTAFASFSKDNPKSRLRPNAIYWEGEAHYALKDYLAAILGFKKVVEQFPKHAKSADALLKIGMSYAKLNDQENARFYWGILLDDFPRSTSAAKAKRMIDAFQNS